MKYTFNTIASYKFNYKTLSILLYVLFLFSTIQLNFSNAGSNNDLEWSFSDQPHPADHTLTRDEKAPLQETAQEQGFTEYCSKLLSAHFNIYNDRFPKFMQTGSADRRFLAWKYHVVVDGFSDGYNGAKHCVQFMAFNRASEANTSNNLHFCGAFSDDSRIRSDREFRNAIEETISYADAGNPYALDSLLILHLPDSNVMLNPDVEFYIRKSLRINDEYKDTWDTTHLEPLLTPERIGFVNAALERGDFASVLNTTAPCPVRPQ